MKTDPSPSNSEKNLVVPEPQINCTECRMNEYLILESIHSLVPRTDGWVAVEYSCGRCESFYAHKVPVQAVAAFLAEDDVQSGVFKFGRHYVHCGEPMEESGMKIAGIAVDEDDLNGVLDVRIPTIALRCRCGFQMTIPK